MIINPGDMPSTARHNAFVEHMIGKFQHHQGYVPNLKEPARFTEKMLWRILFDRNPYYMLLCNKLYVRSFIQPRNIKGLKFPRLYLSKVTIVPEDLAALPDQFVVKSAYGTGLNVIVKDKGRTDLRKLCQKFNSEMPVISNAQGFTYPYNCTLVEEYLGETPDNTPDDYKFHCFRQADGQLEIIVQVDSDRFSNHRQTFLDPHFNPLPFQVGPDPAHDICPTKPDRLADMLDIAKQLSSGFDYVRVDLYLVRNEIYFGEFTPFHGRALRRIAPSDWDYRLGRMWHQTTPYYAP